MSVFRQCLILVTPSYLQMFLCVRGYFQDNVIELLCHYTIKILGPHAVEIYVILNIIG